MNRLLVFRYIGRHAKIAIIIIIIARQQNAYMRWEEKGKKGSNGAFQAFHKMPRKVSFLVLGVGLRFFPRFEEIIDFLLQATGLQLNGEAVGWIDNKECLKNRDF